MQVEDAIALGEYITQHQRALVDTLPLLDEDRVARLLSRGYVEEGHLDIAQCVVANRYTSNGWRDYMYCALHIHCDLVDYVVAYCNDVDCAPKDRVELFVTLFYGPVLMLTDGGMWKYFCKGTWMDVTTAQLRNMIVERVSLSRLGDRLGISPKVVNGLLRDLAAGRVCTALFIPSFNSNRDTKDNVFCMPTVVYDIGHNTLRIGLPSDMSTLKGGVDPDVTAWADRRADMMQTLVGWMSGQDVVDSFLDMLAGAVSEFRPRYALVNSGTGSDGKSTFSHVLKSLFGGYCAILPTKGLSSDARNANDATPLLNMLVGKRLSITPDATDVVGVIASPGFKSISGGDEIYRRALHQEASTVTHRLKMLAMINTNQVSIVLTQISELTRIKIVRWLSKTVTDEDRAVIPAHRLTRSTLGVFNFEKEFLSRFGSCLMSELLGRHHQLRQSGYNIHVCSTIRQWTKELVSPKTILNFLEAYTEKVDEFGGEEVSIETLFVSYVSWRRLGGRFSSTDPTNIDAFTCHIEFYHPVLVRTSHTGTEEHYVSGIRLKSEYDRMGLMFPPSRGGTSMQGRLLLENVLRSNRPRGDPTIAVLNA
jgi:hypothetical protein